MKTYEVKVRVTLEKLSTVLQALGGKVTIVKIEPTPDETNAAKQEVRASRRPRILCRGKRPRGEH